MTEKTETGASPLDIVKWLIAIGLLVGGLFAFYHYEETVLAPLRVLGLIAVIGVAVFVAAATARGRDLVSFMKAANIERQKVVWPTGQETLQTTLVVLVVVILVGLFIWAVDWVFSSLVGYLVA